MPETDDLDKINNSNPNSNAKKWAEIAARANEQDVSAVLDSAPELTPEKTQRPDADAPSELLNHPTYLQLMVDFTQAEQERDDYRNRMFLLQAELENMRKRFERDLANAHKYAIDKLLADLLPVIDSLERGLALQFVDGENGLLKQMHAGMELTLDIMLRTLQKHGVQQINPLAEIFNPTYHEAMAVQDYPTVAPNTILQVVQKGYLLKDRLIRPALVVVAK